jgi:RNA polymerase sigma-70 factor (ECF subfamily)
MIIENENDRLKAEMLYYKYRKLLMNIAKEILLDNNLAEDAIHETFIRVIKNLYKIDENNCPRTKNFLVIICRNISLTMYNERTYLNKRENSIEDITYEEELSYSCPENITISKETREEIANEIEKVDTIYSDVLIFKYDYGYGREEIAETLGINVETVKKRLTRAMTKIKIGLEKEGSK